ncbi:MAG: hypothetical protein CMM00_09355 [Rhodopirellula sp.]|nr:hypothetical protein [Rhodopirellula sp.]MCR9116443.1 hypothetical protein [bacterium]
MAKKKTSKRSQKSVLRKGVKKKSPHKKSSPVGPKSLQYLTLDQLELDGDNPRLGAKAGQYKSQVEILDAVVDAFGVDNVLSSLAVNGYFAAEPLVVVQQRSGKYRVAEGNRRLASCLILSGDTRARHHERRTKQYKELQEEYGTAPISEVPVQVLADDHSLLSYLGVRHIAASQPWDSYAKAAWVAKVLSESKGGLSLEDVSSMIGDQHRTVARALEGFYFVNQLRDNAHFNPDDSYRPGRGSNPAYPFSWVYTALGYGPVRSWLELDELTAEGRDEAPLEDEKLGDGGELLTFLFGNKSKSRQPAITDSRQISDLAKAIANPQSRRLLSRGKSVVDVQEFLKPAKERVLDSLLDAQQSLSNALAPLSEGEVKADDAEELRAPSRKVRNLASDVSKKINELTDEGE